MIGKGATRPWVMSLGRYGAIHKLLVTCVGLVVTVGTGAGGNVFLGEDVVVDASVKVSKSVNVWIKGVIVGAPE